VRLSIKDLGVALCIFALASGCRPTATFPSEAEVRERVHTGMTSREVMAAFGDPTSRSTDKHGRMIFYYFAPSWLHAKPGTPHFIGFQVVFQDDKVTTWSPTQGT
jgi:outer membrane protein assembly factor BamE (lipoprotein component of BamABCDE complex)